LHGYQYALGEWIYSNYVTETCDGPNVGYASHMKPNTMTTKAYNGKPKLIIGSMDIELIIGPHPFQVTFQVMDIHPSYSLLLGRPCIHATGAVVSSLHQRIKFIINGKLVTMMSEEAMTIMNNVEI